MLYGSCDFIWRFCFLCFFSRRGRFCGTTDDPYACILSYRSDEWVPEEYKKYCIYTKPTVQQPDFEKSKCSDDCLRRGMNAWLYRILHGDVSWESFVADVRSSCDFKSVGPEGEFSNGSMGESPGACLTALQLHLVPSSC